MIGATAVHARRLAAAASRKVMKLGSLLALLFVVCALLWRAFPQMYALLLVVSLPIAVVLIAGLQRFHGEYVRARVGVRAEERVASTLSRTGSTAVVNGVLLGSGDVDHVIVGPALAVVETKHGRGVLSVDRAGTLLVNGRRLPRDPVAQARRSAEQLSRRSGRPVQSIVVVVDAQGSPLNVAGTVVTSLRDLPACVSALVPILDTAAAQRLAASLPVAG